MRLYFLFATSLVFTIHCNKNSSLSSADSSNPSYEKSYILLEHATLRFAPSDDPDAAHPTIAGERVNNWKGDLLRGTVVNVVQDLGEWMSIYTEDDATGYLKSEQLVPMLGMREATVLKTVATFRTADLSTQNDTLTLSPGQLLFVFDSVAFFSRVNINADQYCWVKTDDLSFDTKEVKVSKLIVLAKWSKERGDLANNSRLLDKARLQSPDAILVDRLANEVPFETFSSEPVRATAEPTH